MQRELHRWDDPGPVSPWPDGVAADLDRGVHGRVVVVAAPPGAGAAACVRAWLTARTDLRAAWLRLERSDGALSPAELCRAMWDELAPELAREEAGLPTVLVLEGLQHLDRNRSRVLVTTVACLPPSWRIVAMSPRPTDVPAGMTLPVATIGPADLAVDRANGAAMLASAVPGRPGVPTAATVDAVHEVARGWYGVWRAAADHLARAVPEDPDPTWSPAHPDLVGLGGRYLDARCPAERSTIERLTLLGADPDPTSWPDGVTSDLRAIAAAVDAPDPGSIHPVVAEAVRRRAHLSDWARRHLGLLADPDALQAACRALGRPPETASATDPFDVAATGVLLAVGGRVGASRAAAERLRASSLVPLRHLVLAAGAAHATDAEAREAARRLRRTVDRSWPALRSLGVRSAEALAVLADDLDRIAHERLAGREPADGAVAAALRRAGIGGRRNAAAPS